MTEVTSQQNTRANQTRAGVVISFEGVWSDDGIWDPQLSHVFHVFATHKDAGQISG